MNVKFDVKETSSADIIGFNLRLCFRFPLCIFSPVVLVAPFLKDIVPSSVRCSRLHAGAACCSRIIYSWAMRNEVRGGPFPRGIFIIVRKGSSFPLLFETFVLKASDM